MFQTLTLPAMAAWRIATVEYVQLRKYRKHPRGAKQSLAKRTCDPQQPHVPAVKPSFLECSISSSKLWFEKALAPIDFNNLIEELAQIPVPG
ncbi:MAG TPA: hypothetical protein PLD30_14590 [Candidatus Competibacteraceae bacterium]|nr:hypothetical protein [Candidatus Competibacteraceae bacterium]